MKTNMHKNSLDAYTDLIQSGQLTRSQSVVVKILKVRKGLTREQIADFGSMKESSVCGRVRELIDAEIIVEVGKTKTSTGNSAAMLQLKQNYYQ